MADAREIELVFEPQEEGGFHVYAPDLPGLHTQGDDKELRKGTLAGILRDADLGPDDLRRLLS